MVKEGKTVFYDGMRVNKEHLSHMEYILLDAIKDIRTALGLGKICWGLKATVKNSSNICINGLPPSFSSSSRFISMLSHIWQLTRLGSARRRTPGWGHPQAQVGLLIVLY